MYDVVYIEKKKLNLARLLLRGGLAVMVIALLGILFCPEAAAFKVCIFAGVVPAFTGAFLISGYYRCPRCKESLLSNNSLEALKEIYASHCPRCGTKIEIEIIER